MEVKTNLEALKSQTRKLSNPKRKAALMRFFKTGKGEYGEGDVFLGLTLPVVRELTKKYKDLSREDVLALLKSKYHEERIIALIILLAQFKKADERGQKDIFEIYLGNTKYINNWDLVDVTCPNLVGAYLCNRDRKVLYDLARSDSVWERRIAIISTFYFIKEDELDDTLKIAKILLPDKHDLIHKAVGWALREVGKKDIGLLKKFLRENYPEIPRTALRYAIERFPEEERKKYLRGDF